MFVNVRPSITTDEACLDYSVSSVGVLCCARGLVQVVVGEVLAIVTASRPARCHRWGIAGSSSRTKWARPSLSPLYRAMLTGVTSRASTSWPWNDTTRRFAFVHASRPWHTETPWSATSTLPRNGSRVRHCMNRGLNRARSVTHWSCSQNDQWKVLWHAWITTSTSVDDGSKQQWTSKLGLLLPKRLSEKTRMQMNSMTVTLRVPRSMTDLQALVLLRYSYLGGTKTDQWKTTTRLPSSTAR